MSDFVMGIETSCDETAAAIVDKGRNILSNIVSSQIKIHNKYGGVVPEIASRKHMESIIPVIDSALKESKITLDQLSGIAVTYGPGLVGSLLVGLTVAKSISYAQNIPLIGVNHLEAHIYANFLEHKRLKPPIICLIVSGGHTSLVHINDYWDYKILGQTVDDAAGEVFDKISKYLNLGYPGGPIIEKLASKGDSTAIAFPRPLLNKHNYDFSFSGLKTSVIYYIKKLILEKKPIPQNDILASFQIAVADVLAQKTIKAALNTGVNTIALAGGVAANCYIKTFIENMAQNNKIEVFSPSQKLCTDNAVMVASAGFYQLKNKKQSNLSIDAVSRLAISSNE